VHSKSGILWKTCEARQQEQVCDVKQIRKAFSLLCSESGSSKSGRVIRSDNN